MKLTLDVSSIQYNQKPETALYDPKKTSSTESRSFRKTGWTVTATDEALSPEDLQEVAKNERSDR